MLAHMVFRSVLREKLGTGGNNSNRTDLPSATEKPKLKSSFKD